jgi:D-arabinose 1-dehydrogenase-like Zn-dependent alcohol dehydrogenase
VLAATLSPRGTLVSFAAMSLNPMSISPLDVIFKPVTVRGFLMAHAEFAAKLAPAAAQAAEMIASGRMHIPVAATYPLSSIKEAVAQCATRRKDSSGRSRIIQLTSESPTGVRFQHLYDVARRASQRALATGDSDADPKRLLNSILLI